ncbi:unnamed protein product [Meloidogyne enterolobii]|uniref:Uncharacterized protein n=2 Tax=Meloidogyne enterolobii TaxID=390850 RepID=A0ACB0YXC2_MELEN|nr:unnamed protein product [Meloidogyne enterolobii]
MSYENRDLEKFLISITGIFERDLGPVSSLDVAIRKSITFTEQKSKSRLIRTANK